MLTWQQANEITCTRNISLLIKAEFFHAFHGFLCSPSRLTVEDEIIIFYIWFLDSIFLFELCRAQAKCLNDLWHWKIKIKINSSVTIVVDHENETKHFWKLTRMMSSCAYHRRKSLYPEIETELVSKRNFSNIPYNYLQGMFTDFGIFPSEASSWGSLTSKSCISPSITISFRHSRPIWLWSASLLQDQIRSLGPAFAESAFAIRTRGRTLSESTDLVNRATAREAIMKLFEALLLRVTEKFMQLERFWLLLLAFRWHFWKIYII